MAKQYTQIMIPDEVIMAKINRTLGDRGLMLNGSRLNSQRKNYMYLFFERLIRN